MLKLDRARNRPAARFFVLQWRGVVCAGTIRLVSYFEIAYENLNGRIVSVKNSSPSEFNSTDVIRSP